MSLYDWGKFKSPNRRGGPRLDESAIQLRYQALERAWANGTYWEGAAKELGMQVKTLKFFVYTQKKKGTK